MGSTNPANSYLARDPRCRELFNVCAAFFIHTCIFITCVSSFLLPLLKQHTHTTSTKQIPVLYDKRFNDLQEQLAVCAGLHDILHGLIRPILDWPRERY